MTNFKRKRSQDSARSLNCSEWKNQPLRWLHTMEVKGRLGCCIMDLQEFDFSVVHRAGRIHNNADVLSRLVQTNLLDSATTTSAQQNPAFVSTIRVKLSKGRTAIVKLESNKPLVVDPDGKLVNTHDHHSYNGPSSQEGNKIDPMDRCNHITPNYEPPGWSTNGA